MKPNFPIEQIPLPKDQYVVESQEKTQVYLHHSAGRDDVRGMFSYWAKDNPRVATAFGINDSGQVFQAFPDECWAYHLYIRSNGNRLPEGLMRIKNDPSQAVMLEKRSIGIEIANFGPLKYRGGKYYTWVNDWGQAGSGVTMTESKVYDFGPDGFRGYRFYERYTDNEVGALKVLLKYLCLEKYNIPVRLSRNIFDINPDAFKLKPGIYTHCSVRTDKTDIVPQEHMVSMLNSLHC